MRARFMLAALCVATGLFTLPANSRPVRVRLMDQHTLMSLARTLKLLDAQYDPEERMLRRPYSSPGYHTTLKGGFVHPTRESLRYARALLEFGDVKMNQRAFAIIERVVGLQDQDPSHKTFGIWSWFLEEPLEKMSPPDWNWADFCGSELLEAVLCNGYQMPPELRKKVDTAILCAARSIQKRNVGPGYTNIAVLGTYVTLIAGEAYDDPGLRSYGLARLKRIVDYTRQQGAFTEYNSPTYTLVTMKALAHLVIRVQDDSARQMAQELYRRTWEELCRHWHPPTQQWAGPHSRCYSTLLQAGAKALIQQATDGRLDLGADTSTVDLESYRVPIRCPDEFLPMLMKLDAPRTEVETFVRREKRSTVGTTFLHPAFALGSINRGSFWNQARPLVAYYGTPRNPGYLQVRLLKNDYDLAAGRIYTAQQGGRTLSIINIASDGGDTHPSLNKLKAGMFNARELRLRFELGGSGRSAKITLPDAPSGFASIDLGTTTLQVAAPLVHFADQQPRWQQGTTGKSAWLDLILYSGPDRAFQLARLPAAVVVAINFGAVPKAPTATGAAEQIHASWDQLSVTASAVGMKSGELDRQAQISTTP